MWGFGEKINAKSTFMLEVFAVMRALKIIDEVQISWVVVEMDNKELIGCLHNTLLVLI